MRSKIPLFDHGDPKTEQPTVMRLADIRDDGIYTVTWRDGRTATTIITNEKFEILTDLAVEAYCDRYFREAVLTCASALDAYPNASSSEARYPLCTIEFLSSTIDALM